MALLQEKFPPHIHAHAAMHGLVQRLGAHHLESAPRITAFIAARTGEGTSTMAREYAETLSTETGQKILLIDAGITPARSYLREISAPLGLVEAALAEKSPVDAVTPASATANVFSARMLGSAENRKASVKIIHHPEFWERLLQSFDAIVIDAPPLQRSFDGVLLSAKADAVLLVVEAEKTPKAVIERLRDSLATAGAPVAGIVMNKRRYYIPERKYKKF